MKNFKTYTSPNFMEIRTMTTDKDFWVAGIDAAVALDLNEVWNVLDNCISGIHKKTVPVDALGKEVNIEFIDEVGLNVMMQLAKTSYGRVCCDWMVRGMLPELRRKNDKLAARTENENCIMIPESKIKYLVDDTFGKLRYVKLESKLWFFGADVVGNVGYAKGSATTLIRHYVDKKNICKAYISKPRKVSSTFILINLDGLRTFMYSSRKPKAKEYLDWIVSNLNREAGNKQINEPKNQNKDSELANPDLVALKKMIVYPDFGIHLLTALKNEQKKCKDLQLENQKLNEKAKEETQVDAKSTTGKSIGVSVREFVPVLNYNKISTSVNCLYACLRNNGYLIADGKEKNLPTHRSMRLGIMTTKHNPYGSNMTTLITPKGQEYFVHMFKSGKLKISCI